MIIGVSYVSLNNAPTRHTAAQDDAFFALVMALRPNSIGKVADCDPTFVTQNRIYCLIHGLKKAMVNVTDGARLATLMPSGGNNY